MCHSSKYTEKCSHLPLNLLVVFLSGRELPIFLNFIMLTQTMKFVKKNEYMIVSV